jgi:Aldo/keto reductase family
VIAYSPLAQELLGGKYGLDNRPGGVRGVNPLFGTENLRRVEPLLQMLRDVATKSAPVALAWLISLPGVVAIPGAPSVEQLEFDVAAADIELPAGSRDALTDAARAFRPTSALGAFLRYRPREVGPSLTGTLKRCGAGERASCNHNRHRRRRIGAQDRMHHLYEVCDGHHPAGHDAPR